MNVWVLVLAAGAGYLLGSISFARLVTRIAAPEADITGLVVPVAGTEEAARVEVVGANAASMILGPKLGLAVGLLDMLKVILLMLAFRLYAPDQPYYLVASVTGLLGHNWPLYHRFRGGRGFSVIFGSFVVVDWLGALVTPLVGTLVGIVILGNASLGYVAWLWLMIPWLWFRTHDVVHLVYALVVNLIFLVATLPEIRTFARYRREGKLDAYMQGLMESSPRWRGMQKLIDRFSLFRRRG
jgi:glycerol-3-phosphate acyltransferase PlsY